MRSKAPPATFGKSLSPWIKVLAPSRYLNIEDDQEFEVVARDGDPEYHRLIVRGRARITLQPDHRKRRWFLHLGHVPGGGLCDQPQCVVHSAPDGPRRQPLGLGEYPDPL